MKKWPLLLALPALVAITATARAADDPDTVLRQIRTENSKRLQEQEPDIAALIKTRADTAKAAVKGVDPATVELAKALAWAQLYYFAEMYAEPRTAARRFLTSSPTPEAAFNVKFRPIWSSSFRPRSSSDFRPSWSTPASPTEEYGRKERVGRAL